MNNVIRAFSSSKTLHQVLGMRDPEPFVTPPEMPFDLGERFEAGLRQYEQLFTADVFVTSGAEKLQAAAPSQKGKTGLADILEEKESPVRAKATHFTKSTATNGLKINIPKWTSGKQAVAVAQHHAFPDSDSDVANDTASENTDYEFELEDQGSWRYGSSTTLAVSDLSRSGSPSSANEALPALSFPQRTSSLLSHGHVNSSADMTAPPTRHSISSILPPALLPKFIQPAVPEITFHPGKRAHSYPYNGSSMMKRADSLPILSLPTGIAQSSWGCLQGDSALISSDIGSDVELHHNTSKNAALNFNQDVASLSVPHITVRAPSPRKMPISRKRALPPSTQCDFGPSLSQRVCRDDTAGLPVLPFGAEVIWRSEFPGNTNALLTILLTWSHSMWTFHRRLPDPKQFAVHRIFPYSLAPPIKKQLLSVSFYDTSVEPHREVRFMGPGDVQEMSYHEVDVFGDPVFSVASEAPTQPNSPIDAIKQTFGFADTEGVKHIRYMAMSQRAKTGEGRWCYILIKGHRTQDQQTPPHLVLAWHISAVTASSDCLHTIFPDNAIPKRTTETQSKLKRFSSLQNFGTALRNPARFNFHQTLRSASSSSELPSFDANIETEQQDGTTLHREVLKMEKAGNIPLIEGYRVDVAAFRAWMHACGKGCGKVIMWRERQN